MCASRHELLTRSMRAISMLLALALAAQASALRVTVFGGSGFIGQRVCQQLTEAGCDVVSCSRSGRPADAGGAWADAVEWASADASVDDLAPAVAGSDAVVSVVGGFKAGKASPTGTADIPLLFATVSDEDQELYRNANGPPNARIAAAAKDAACSRFAYCHVAADVENAIAGGIPGYFRGKGEALEAIVGAYGADAFVVAPSSVTASRSDPLAKALDSPLAKFAVSANAFVGNIGYRGEDLVTKVALTPPVAVDDVAAVLAAAARDAAGFVPATERATRRLDPDNTDAYGGPTSREYVVTARFVDGTTGIREAAAKVSR